MMNSTSIPEIIRPLSSFIYKVATRCNLNCTYCYEYNMGDHSWKEQPHFTNTTVIQTLATRVKEHALANHLDFVNFSFHGGEPLLAGAEFFRDAVSIIRDVIGPNIGSSFGVQTNGTLITEKVIKIFNEEDISIGLSLDGPQIVNDKYRIYTNGRGSFDDVMRGIQLLLTPDGRKIFRGILTVIDVTSDPLDVFEFLASLSPPNIDFLLPHGNWETPPLGKEQSFDSTRHADWLITIFDSWFDGNQREIGIRTFEEIIEYKLGGEGRLETLGLSPVTLIGIAADGSIEGVDTLKSVYPGAHKLGFNVFQHSFNEVLAHPNVRARQLGLEALCETCMNCPLVETCGGGYFPHRWSKNHFFKNPSVYCSDLTKLILHIYKRVDDVLASTSVAN